MNDFWPEIHEKVRRVAERLDGGRGLSAEDEAAILDARARELARRPDPGPGLDRGEVLDLVVFQLAGESYAVECRHVLEVVPLRSLTPIPGTPPFIAGVVNLRGRILDIVDLKSFFELPPQGLTDLTRVIALQGQGVEFGLLAETVNGTLTLRTGDLQGPLPTMTGIRADFLRGIAPGGEIVLDAGRLLTDQRLIVNDDR